MISPQAQKGFIFAFLCILAGGILCLAGGGLNSIGIPFFSLIGLGLMGLGLLIGFIALFA